LAEAGPKFGPTLPNSDERNRIGLVPHRPVGDNPAWGRWPGNQRPRSHAVVIGKRSMVITDSAKAYGGFKFRIICGYPGSLEFPLVLARGEVDLISGSRNAWRRRTDVIDGTLRPVIQSGLVRHKELPDIPLMQELIDDPKQKQVVEFLSAGATIGRAPLVHSAVPADRIAALRSAFDQMVKDPEFVKDADRAGAALDPTPGIEVQSISAAILTTPKDVFDMAISAEK
jgi:hypothetical protein